jgi:D-alanyl-D-alanine dipeptidase
MIGVPIFISNTTSNLSSSSIDDFILISNPEVLNKEIIENGEPLIDVSTVSDLMYGISPEIENNVNYTKIRKNVYLKLKNANSLLKVYSVKICLYEGLRSLSLQKVLFESRYLQIKGKFKDRADDFIFNETMKYVAPVCNLDGSKNVPPHSTGGAVDVYLIDLFTNEIIDMGIHPKDLMDFLDLNMYIINSNLITSTQRYYRELMADVLNEVGFVNYPSEYWHWSYGDRYWAYVKKEPNAIYGSIV